MRFTPAQLAAMGHPVGGKYRAKRTAVDGINFHSKAEADFYSYLKSLMSARLIRYFIRQPLFDLPGGVTYRADFLVVSTSVQVVDVKGFETKDFKIKKKIVEALYPVTIELVKADRKGLFDWMPTKQVSA